MERLNGIDKNSGNFVSTSAKNILRRRMKVLEGQAVSDRPLTTQSRLHAVPPAVISAGEAYNQLSASVESRQSDRGVSYMNAPLLIESANFSRFETGAFWAKRLCTISSAAQASRTAATSFRV